MSPQQRTMNNTNNNTMMMNEPNSDDDDGSEPPTTGTTNAMNDTTTTIRRIVSNATISVTINERPSSNGYDYKIRKSSLIGYVDDDVAVVDDENDLLVFV
jgi:hypothetical protein